VEQAANGREGEGNRLRCGCLPNWSLKLMERERGGGVRRQAVYIWLCKVSREREREKEKIKESYQSGLSKKNGQKRFLHFEVEKAEPEVMKGYDLRTREREKMLLL
jgi:hypothetical protein